VTDTVLVLTMAGRSQRFSRVGVLPPKWAISIAGRTMLEHALEAATPLLDAGAELRLVVRRADAATSEFTAVLEKVRYSGTVVRVDDQAPGQAVDAAAALGPKDDSRPLVVWGVDTALQWNPSTARAAVAETGDWILLAPLAGDHWSFAKLRADGTVAVTAEKRRISEHASVGMYGFASCRVFRSVVVAEKAHGTGEQIYVAPLYNRLISAGAKVNPVHIAADDVISLGTPDEVLHACRRFDWPVPVELWPYVSGRRR
jgi:dTDP-glucose pyrophosphorylase